MASVSDGENSHDGFSPPGSVDSNAEASHPPSLLNSPQEAQGDEMGEGSGAFRKKSKLKDDKICGICGDKALGCNFDAISCESCKAFFRRNALKDKKSKCLFNGSCNIDVNTRRFCPHCRLKKCFSIGMKSELILRVDQRKRRADKVKINREKKVKKDFSPGDSTTGLDVKVEAMSPPQVIQQAPLTPQPTTPQAPVTPQSVTPVPTAVTPQPVQAQPQQTQPVQVPIMISLENPMATFNAQVAAAFNMTVPSPVNILGSSQMLTNNCVTPAVSSTNNLLSMMKLTKLPSNYDSLNYTAEQCFVRRLTPEEDQLLTELQQVYDLSFTVDLEPLIHIKQLDPSLNQLVNQSSITVLRIIKFAKRLDEFLQLPQECQIGILKGTWIHILLLRSVSLYDCDRDVWVTPKGDIPTEILKNATGYVQLHDSHVNYCKSLKSIVQDDLAIVIILLVIVLFSPEGPHVTVREIISNIQDKYLLLLKHYLESKYTYIRAANMFPGLMSKMKELKDLAESHGKYLLDINPREIEPIMLEILDLK